MGAEPLTGTTACVGRARSGIAEAHVRHARDGGADAGHRAGVSVSLALLLDAIQPIGGADGSIGRAADRDQHGNHGRLAGADDVRANGCPHPDALGASTKELVNMRRHGVMTADALAGLFLLAALATLLAV